MSEQEFEKMDLCELIEFYRANPHEDIPDWFEDWLAAVYSSFPIEDLADRISAIEASLDVILSVIGNQSANTSIKGLIRMKGGYH